MKRRNVASVVVVTALCAALLGWTSRETDDRIKSTAEVVTHPAQRALEHLKAGLHGLIEGSTGSEQAAEIERLRSRVARLETEVSDCRAAKLENEHLKKLLGFRERDERTLVACQVVRRGCAVGWFDTLTVNRGKVDGLCDGMAVISSDGALVGSIKRADRYSSVVELITAPGSLVPCLLPKSGAAGLLRGGETEGGDGLGVAPVCNLEKLSSLTEVEETNVVYTSGFGENIPAGLFVGFVQKVEREDSGVLVKAEVSPAADLHSIQFVFAVIASS